MNDIEALIAMYFLFWLAIWYGLGKMTKGGK